jgi:class 3 adenylate cyclase
VSEARRALLNVSKEAHVPGSTVTFLFTDIEGSTQLWEREPERMQPALARHDSLVRAAIASTAERS